MHILAAGCILLLAAVGARQGRDAGSGGTHTAVAAFTSRSIEDSIRTLEQVWADAVQIHDSATLERLVAPDFVVVPHVDTAAPPLPRAVWMENTLRRLRVDSIRINPATVTIRGDTATATLMFVWAGQFMTKPPFRDSTELEDTWIRSAGDWRVHRRVLAR